ncbi:MAG: hypothetical protein ACP5O8_00055 [Candidatus Aenigmatarchaeota archaeon]
MKIKEIIGKILYKRLLTYLDYDRIIKKNMEDVVHSFYLGLHSPTKEEELKEIYNYQTRLYAAGTVETLTICGANLGFKEALKNPKVKDIATTIRLAFGYADMLDTDNDEYDPRVLILKKLDPKTVEEKLHKHKIYSNIVRNLDNLIMERFKLLHPSSLNIYISEEEKVMEGQKSDIEDHFCYLQGDFERLRDKYPNYQACMELLVKKLGLMGRGAAHIAYLESNGKSEAIKETEGEFFTNAGVLLQFWSNDVKKIMNDIENLETNPIITTAVCKYKDANEINKNLIKRLVKDDPQILDKMANPYQEGMEKALEGIKKFEFDFRTHKGLALMVKSEAKKEKINFFKNFGLI